LNVTGSDRLESLVSGLERQFRRIAIAAQMSQIDLAQVRAHQRLEHASGRFVREMAVTAENPLFHTPGAADIILQHFHIMIRLQNEDLRFADALNDEFGRVAEVREETDMPVV
jgi:hypothetical protein